MTEKTDFKTDEETGSTTIHIGVEPITGLEMYRRFIGLESNLIAKRHVITFEEFLLAKDGKIYNEFYRFKNYLVLEAKYNQWFAALAPTLLPAINATLETLAIDVQSEFVI